jgi:hypothetical protein
MAEQKPQASSAKPPAGSKKRGPSNSELRLQRLAAEEPDAAERGILEVFDDVVEEPSDEDVPLARDADDSPA